MFHVKHRSPHILLINPWITDFAAYNFWIRPLGLLYIASLLSSNGFQVTLIDCLDFYSKVKNYGDGKFYKTKIEKPSSLKSIQRNYCRYGIPEEMLLKRILMLEEKPDLIGITSGMTYWYPAVFQLIEIIKKLFKRTPIILGGIYANLCYEHAQKNSGADIIFKNGDEWEAVKSISRLTDFKLQNPNAELLLDQLPYPLFDRYPQLKYICMATTRGCPFHCTYCASPILREGFMRRDPFKVVEEIEYWSTQHQIQNIAFYDDALLIDSSRHFIPMIKEVIKKGIECNFHVPNALHIKEIDEEVATLLYKGHFRTIRLGFETSNEEVQIETGGKVDNKTFLNAINYLKKAGYTQDELGVYIMAGLPGQRVGEVEESVAFVREAGAKPILVEYSPIPKTPLFEKAKRYSPFDIEREPLFQNNSLFPCQWDGFTLADFRRLKEKIKREEI